MVTTKKVSMDHVAKEGREPHVLSHAAVAEHGALGSGGEGGRLGRCRVPRQEGGGQAPRCPHFCGLHPLKGELFPLHLNHTLEP